MIAAILLITALAGGHSWQTVHAAYVARVEGDCQSGDYCSLTAIDLAPSDAFASDDFTCVANQLNFPNVDANGEDAALELYPQSRNRIAVYFANDSDDAIQDGTRVRISWTCQGQRS